jgi:hypothetical protein
MSGTTKNDVERLLAAANELATKAKSDPALAQRLLDDPTGLIAQAAGRPIPAGVQVAARRSAHDEIQIDAALDPAFEGELDDGLLETVAGGDKNSKGAGQAVELTGSIAQTAGTVATHGVGANFGVLGSKPAWQKVGSEIGNAFKKW